MFDEKNWKEMKEFKSIINFSWLEILETIAIISFEREKSTVDRHIIQVYGSIHISWSGWNL